MAQQAGECSRIAHARFPLIRARWVTTTRPNAARVGSSTRTGVGTHRARQDLPPAMAPTVGRGTTRAAQPHVGTARPRPAPILWIIPGAFVTDRGGHCQTAVIATVVRHPASAILAMA